MCDIPSTDTLIHSHYIYSVPAHPTCTPSHLLAITVQGGEGVTFDSHNLFKWKVNFKIRPDSYLFLSPNLVYHKKELDVNENGHQEEEEAEEGEEDSLMDVSNKKFATLKECLIDVLMRIDLLFHVICLPLLKIVSIKDSSKRGNISLSGAKVNELSSWLSSPSDRTIKQKQYCTNDRASECYVLLLELPVSRYIMKGVYLSVMDWSDLPDDNFDRFTKSDDDFEDKDEAAYSEAMMEIFRKHSDRIERLELAGVLAHLHSILVVPWAAVVIWVLSVDAFNTSATEFGTNKASPRRNNVNTRKEDQLEAEVERLREQLTQVNIEISEPSSKYEKLSAISGDKSYTG
ncbi:hypothetical protein Tco_0349811 [Tanacetum coccineum]